MAGAQTRGSTRAGRAPTPTRERTRAEEREDHRRQTERDEPHKRAYTAGYNGDDDAEHRTSDELSDQYDQGASDRRRHDRAERVGQAKAQGISVANDGAGYVLGLIAYALLVNYLQGGVKGTRAWLSAKFLNKPTAGAATAKAPAKPASPSPAGVPE